MDLPVLNLGTSVIVADPCYLSNSEHMFIEIPVTPGYWEPYISMSDEGSWGDRVSVLGITRSGFNHSAAPKFIGYAGVDSGQMMIIDADAISKWDTNENPDRSWVGGSFDYDNPEWKGTLSYFGAAAATLGEEQSGVLEEEAVVSSSGYGDGSYPVYAYEDLFGQVERIEVRFIEDEDEGWSDDWDEEEEDGYDEW